MISENELNKLLLNALDDVLCVVWGKDGTIISPKDPIKLENYRRIIENPTNVSSMFFIKQTGEWYELKKKYIEYNGTVYRLEYYHNVTKYKENEQSLQRDYLTGIANRESTIFRINEYIMYALKNNEEFSVMLADVDHFKDINDTYGHLFGDTVLKNIGTLIAQNIRHREGMKEDIAGRYGGDEFFGLIGDISYEDSLGWIERAHEKIKNLIHTSFDNTACITDVTMSIGMYHVSKKDLAEFNRNSLTIDQIRKTLFDRCDQVLYKVKKEHHLDEQRREEIARSNIH